MVRTKVEIHCRLIQTIHERESSFIKLSIRIPELSPVHNGNDVLLLVPFGFIDQPIRMEQFLFLFTFLHTVWMIN